MSTVQRVLEAFTRREGNIPELVLQLFTSTKSEFTLHVRDDVSATAVVVLHSPDGVMRYVSDNIEYLLGRQPEQVIGTLSYDYIHPDELREAEIQHGCTLAGNEVFSMVQRLRCLSGEWRWVRIFSRALRNELNGLVEMIATCIYPLPQDIPVMSDDVLVAAV